MSASCFSGPLNRAKYRRGRFDGRRPLFRARPLIHTLVVPFEPDVERVAVARRVGSGSLRLARVVRPPRRDEMHDTVESDEHVAERAGEVFPTLDAELQARRGIVV